MTARRLALLAAFLATAWVSPSFGQQIQPPKGDPVPSKDVPPKPQPKDEKQPPKDEKAQPKDDKPAATTKEEKPKLPPTVVTDGSVIIAKQKVEYKATTGALQVTDRTGKAKANIFYMAYTRKTGESMANRPLTFCFNGGPGSASAYVHLGFFGPKRVLINNDGLSAPSPVQLVENDSSILDVTDLVMIDPVSTGLSRAENDADAKLFHGLEEDTSSVGDFIREYVAKNERKDSPVYVAGESYGTTRAAALSTYIQNKGGVKLAGIMLISAVLDFQTILFGSGNDLPYSLFLPTYTATAYFHGKLDKKWATDLPTALKEAQKYADGPYVELLHKGHSLSEYEKQAAAKQIATLTGLTEEFVLKNDLRIEATRFRSELLRDQQIVVGRLDSRVSAKRGGGPGGPPAPGGTTNPATGPGNPGGTNPGGTPGSTPSTPGGREFRGGGGDPSQAMLSNLFTDAMKTYLPDGLGYKTDTRYTLTAQVQPWNYGQAGTNRYANVAPRLRVAMEKDKALKVFVASGYTDLATPYAGTDYTLAHMGPRSLMSQVTVAYYEAGHMMYSHEPSRKKLRDDLVKFMTPAATPEKK